MNMKKIFYCLAIMVSMVSCKYEVSDTTQIKGTVTADGIDEVAVVSGTAVDTLVPVIDGKFAVEIPTDLAVLSVISAADYSVSFIADGTPLTVVLDENPSATSKYPKVSVQEKMNAHIAEENAVGLELSEKQQEIISDTSLTDELKQEKFMAYYEELVENYIERNIQTVKDNSDNIISLVALQGLVGQCSDEEVISLIDGLDPSLQVHSFVKDLRESVKAKLETAPGTMFKDFTVNSVVGMTRSVPPQPKYAEVKFSDYVGKGKYVLVDFWAPWCGPCKKEIPNIKTVYEKYADKGLEVLSIAVWERQPVEVTIETAEELGMDWLHINNAGSVPTSIYGIEGIPHLMLIGPDGTILERGFHGLEGIEAAVAKYIK